MEKVILVNENDEEIGEEEKITAHLEGGKLHRAFSIFVLNGKGELLLQKRAKDKYHAGGLWTNTCCGHPRPGETIVQVAYRRLEEEMGFRCDLEKKISFIYKTDIDEKMIEHEYLHLFVGKFGGVPEINLSEVEEWKWVAIDNVLKDIENNPMRYTSWFKEYFKIYPYLLKDEHIR